MTMLLMFLIFSCFATALGALAGILFSPASAMSVRLNTLLGRREVEGVAFFERSRQWLESLGKSLPKSSAELSKTRSWLIQAGYRDSRHVAVYFGIRAFAAIAFLILVFLLGLGTKSPILLVVAPALGYFLPPFLLKRRIKTRQLAIELSLPDVLDLATICVEAGLGLDQAVERVATELRFTDPELSSELGLVTLETRAGKTRAEALGNLAQRTGVEDIRMFVTVLLQAERFGTSIADSLRVHADALRTERRQRAEERAAKIPAKMTPFLVLFIFPVMFLVLIGPTIISIVRTVLPELGQ